MTMIAKTLLLKEINREFEYLNEKDVGTEEYNKSLDRFNTLVDKLAEIEKAEDEQEDRRKNKVIDIVKFVGGGVISISMAVYILKFEQTGSITTALRSLVTKTATNKMF
jgi:hypothetical protein